MADPRDLYNRIILDHGEHPRHAVLPAPPRVERVAVNPLCGDRVRLAVRFDGERIAAIGCETRGCALSVAAGSIMCQLVLDHGTAHARALFAQLGAAIRERGAIPESDAAELLRVFAPVADFPARHECVMLPWQALMAACDEPR